MNSSFINQLQYFPSSAVSGSAEPSPLAEPIEAIILAGGLGTRLRSVVSELPKCMAPVNGKPFIEYVIDYLQKQGVAKFIFALGYKTEPFQEYLPSKLSANQYQLSIETEPLGTGGAIYQACAYTGGKAVLVVNGDTLFKADIKKLMEYHHLQQADCTLSLKPMRNFDRYGVVQLNKDHSIQEFKEKKSYESGLINGGVYALNAPNFLKQDFPSKFSFEKDYLEKFYTSKKMVGLIQDAYFIDIGIPEDYGKAQTELNTGQ